MPGTVLSSTHSTLKGPFRASFNRWGNGGTERLNLLEALQQDDSLTFSCLISSSPWVLTDCWSGISVLVSLPVGGLPLWNVQDLWAPIFPHCLSLHWSVLCSQCSSRGGRWRGFFVHCFLPSHRSLWPLDLPPNLSFSEWGPVPHSSRPASECLVERPGPAF